MLNKILHGDCMNIMSDIKDKSIDMIILDPPYGTTKCSWDVQLPLPELWKHFWRIVKPNSPVLIFGNEPFASSIRLSDKNYRYDWYWQKERGANFIFAKRMPMKVVECICIFYKHQPKYYPQMWTSTHKEHKHIINSFSPMIRDAYPSNPKKLIHTLKKDPYSRYPIQIIKVNKDMQRSARFHPSQKPIALLEYLIKTYSDEGDIVLDPCCGSGSTCVAAANLGRKYIGIEQDTEYVDISNWRLERD